MKLTPFALILTIGFAFSSFADDRPGKVELEGVIQKLPVNGIVGTWIVSERVVVVTSATVIEQDDRPVEVGAKVEIEGMLDPDGIILARKIETDD